MAIDHEEMKQFIKASATSNIAMSTRRLLFNYLTEPVAERGYFHVDQMYGGGSGVLIRFKGAFYLLTAKHVLTNNMHGCLQNESPFWVPVRSQPRCESLVDFLFPRRLWNISELIDCNIPYVDTTDICLVELFEPSPNNFPDHFIEILGSSTTILRQEEFSNGLFLVTSGFPFRTNSFDFDSPPDGFTHSTYIQRQSVPGLLVLEPKGQMYISYEITDANVTSEFLDGMSGGAVYNVEPDVADIRLAGISLSGGTKISRFYPAYALVKAVLSHRDSTYENLDPAAVSGLS